MIRSLTVVATLVVLSAVRLAWAEPVDPFDVRVDLHVQRCSDAPMSLSLTVVEQESARALSPQSLVSNGRTPEPAVPTPVAARPFTPSPTACDSPDDPACHIDAPPPAHQRASIEMVVPALVPCTGFVGIPGATVDSTTQWAEVSGGPQDGFRRRSERPPT